MPLSRRTKTSVTVHQPHIPISSQSTSYSEDDYIDDSYDYTEPDEDWEDEDDLQPSDSASASNGHVPIHHRAARRSHRVVPQYRQHPQSHQGHQAQAPPSVDHPNEAEWAGHYGRAQSAYYQQAQTSHAPYIAGQAARGHHGYHQQQGNHVGAYMGAYPNGNQMVPYANYGANNPFSPMGNGSNGNNFYNGEGRGMYDMMPYQHNGFYGNPQHYGVPAHMQQFQMVPAPPVPAPTEHPAQSTTPAPKEPPAPPPPDPEKIRLEAEVAAFKKVQEEAKAAEKQREIEAQIRKDAEDNFQRRMEDMRKAQEEAQKEIERARNEAERAARERIEAERKAEDERQKAHNEAMQRAEQNARMRFEAELKAAEERRKQEEEDRKRAEEAARIRLEAAIKAEAEAKAAADKKAAEEVARLKQIEEDAKRKAEADAAAKVEKEKADAAAKAEADAAAKKEAEELKKKYQEEAKAKFEEAAKKKSDKAPIKFKDAVGRKFSFPFHLCATWQGMEELIKQAFLQVDVLGPHVQEGHYDLIGPNGEIILPSVWEKVVEPDWSITMTMWPIEKSPPLARPPPPGGKIPIPPLPNGRPGVPPPGRRPGGAVPAGPVPLPPGMWPPGARPARPAHGIDIVTAAPPKTHKKEKRGSASVLTFLAGKPAKKKSSKK